MPKPQPDKVYRTFISKHECVFCGKRDDTDDDGDPRVDPCHILTWGSTFIDHGNIIPACWKCHRHMFEHWPTKIKRLFLPLGAEYLMKFREKVLQ